MCEMKDDTCPVCEKARELINNYKEKDEAEKEILKNREKQREPMESEVS